MKKKFILLISLISPLLSGCNNSVSSLRITFGKLYDSSLSSKANDLYLHTTSISYDDLNRKIQNKENFILSVYEYKTLLEGNDIECICYTSFAYSLNKYMQKNNAEIYAIDPNDFASNDRFSLNIALGDQTLAIFSDGKLIKQEHNSENALSTLEKVEGFLDSFISWSKMLYISKNQLDSILKSEGSHTIGYLRKSCSDCSYLSYNFLKEYNKADFSKEIYVVECDVTGIRYDSSNKLDKEQWQSFKDEYGLSNKYNTNFGYLEGYIPAFMTYTNNGQSYTHFGEFISDGAVYMNDIITIDNETCKISDSYWNGNSHPFFDSLDSKTKTTLKGLDISKDEYENYGDDGILWKREYSSKYHDPLIKGFLDYYTK